MSLKSVNSLEKSKYEIEINIPADEFEAAVEAVYKRSVGNITVPGFRKGKAPRRIIEKMYGADAFHGEAIELVFPKFYADAIKEAELDPITDPEIEILSSDGEGVAVKAVFTNKPVVEVGEYKGLEAEKIIRPVTEEMVDAEVEEVRRRNGRMITVEDRPAQDGDTSIIDFEGFVDDVAFAGGKGENHSLVLGSGQFIPGFEEQIVGHSVGDEFDVNVSFPEEYHAEDLKGKAAVFKVKLNELKHLDLPALDDEFAKDVSEFDSLAEYRESVKAKIADRFAKTAQNEAEKALEEKIVEITKVDVPDVMVDSEVENQVRDFDNRLKSSGMALDMYLQYMGTDLNGLREQYRPNAVKALTCRLALEKIASIEGIEPEDELFEAEFKKIAESYNIDIETVKKSITKEMLATDLKTSKAFELVRDAAKITEREEKTDEKNEA